MPSEPDPKNHYSYEEMISRLRETRQEGGKVREEERSFDPETGKVTVRKRKRKRSGGTPGTFLRDPSWLRLVRRGLFIGIPALLALALLLYVVLSASVGTGVFQQGLGETLARKFGLPEAMRLQDSRLNGVTLSVGRAEGHGPSNSTLKAFALEGTDLRLELSSFFGGSWDVDFCTIRRGGIRLGLPVPGEATAMPPSNAKASGFFLSERPEDIRFNGFSVWDGMILFGSQPEDKAPGFRNIRASFSRREEAGASFLDGQITGTHEGRIDLPGWPALGLDSMRLHLYPDKVVVLRSDLNILRKVAPSTSAAARAASGTPATVQEGVIEISGLVPLQAGTAADLRVDLRNVPLGSLMPRGAGRVLGENAMVDTEGAHLTWDASDPEATWKFSGRANFPKIAAAPSFRIQSLALIPALADLTGGELAEGLDADVCQLDFSSSASGTTFENIQITGAAKFQIVGSARMQADGSLTGELKLGIAPDLLLGRIPPFFKRGQDGYHWVDVVLSGSAVAPIEDLSARLTGWVNNGAVGQPDAGEKPLPGIIDPEAVKKPAGTAPGGGAAEKDKAEEYFRSITNDKPGAPPAPKP